MRDNKAKLAKILAVANQGAQICAPSQQEAAQLLNAGLKSVKRTKAVQCNGTGAHQQ